MKDTRNSQGSPKTPFLGSFVRSQMSSFMATCVDYGVFIIASRFLGVFYVWASGIGAVFGAIVSFLLGRNWAFRRKDGKFTHQAIRYIIASTMSIFLNVNGIYFFTEYFGIADYISKIIVSLLVGVFFNFLMFRYFVYK